MKSLSIKKQIIAWILSIVAVVISLCMLTIFVAAREVLYSSIQADLISVVEKNVDEVEFLSKEYYEENKYEGKLYIAYSPSYIMIDDNYLDVVDGVYTSLYTEEGALLYGDNPILAKSGDILFVDGVIRTVLLDNTRYYIYDDYIEFDTNKKLWLRGIISEARALEELFEMLSVFAVSLPFILVFTLLAAYFISKRILNPVSHIVSIAKSIGDEGDLSQRINLVEGADELKLMAGTFDYMFDKLEQSFNKERQFTSDLSHELRTPMSVIIAQCEYSLQEEDDYEEGLQVIYRQARKMNRLISDMLEFSRLSRGESFYKLYELNLSKICSSIAEDLAMINENSIKLHHEIEDDIYIRGNEELLARILSNLISNAYKYGKEAGNIWLSLSREAGKAILVVKDDGIGMDEEALGKIFNRFYQADSSRQSRGAGLGLSMVAEILKLHAGSIEVESEAGLGTVFYIRFKALDK